MYVACIHLRIPLYLLFNFYRHREKKKEKRKIQSYKLSMDKLLAPSFNIENETHTSEKISL